MSDNDWYNDNISDEHIREQNAQNEQQYLEQTISQEGYREGLLHITEEQEKALQEEGYQKGYNEAKLKFTNIHFIELILSNKKLFKSELIEICEQAKNNNNYLINYEEIFKQI